MDMMLRYQQWIVVGCPDGTTSCPSASAAFVDLPNNLDYSSRCAAYDLKYQTVSCGRSFLIYLKIKE
jgi:hypothetical protein